MPKQIVCSAYQTDRGWKRWIVIRGADCFTFDRVLPTLRREAKRTGRSVFVTNYRNTDACEISPDGTVSPWYERSPEGC